jgi:hypothetical protein
MSDNTKIIKIPESEDSPEIILDSENFILKISGPSFPEDAFETYQPVMKWFKSIKDDMMKLTCEFDFSILSSASNKMLFELLLKLEDLYQNGKDIAIFWYHDDFDEDMQEEGESFAQTVHIPFKFITK